MGGNFIIESFWQRGANCACVAFIKALLLKYGSKAGLRVSKKGECIEVRLPDGDMLSLTMQEIRDFNKKNELSFRRYKHPDKKKRGERIKFVVQLLFAVLVKNMHFNGYRSRKPGIENAISILTKKGVQTVHFHRYLGLKRGKTHQLSNRNIWRVKKKISALIYNNKHIVVASQGYYDNTGHSEELRMEIPLLLGEKATHCCEII